MLQSQTATAPQLQVVPKPAKEEPYIKVFINPLRELIRTAKLSRAELGELIILALRIDENNECFPSKTQCAEDMAMKSANHARDLHKRLKAKQVITYTEGGFDRDGRPHRSPHFYLPKTCFKYGSDSYSDRNTTSRGSRNTTSRGSRNTDSGMSPNTDSKQESQQQQPTEVKPIQNNTGLSSLKEGIQQYMLSKGLETQADQQGAEKQLIQLGVAEKEAKLIAQQFPVARIREAIAGYARNKNKVANPGGWLRNTIETMCKKKIEYEDGLKQGSLPKTKRAEVDEQVDQLLFKQKQSASPLENLINTAAPAGSLGQLSPLHADRLWRIARGNDQEFKPGDLRMLVVSKPEYRETMIRIGIIDHRTGRWS